MIKTAIAYTLGCFFAFQLDTIPTIHFGLLVLVNSFLFLFKPIRMIAVFCIAATITLWQIEHRLNDRLADVNISTPLAVTGNITTIPEYKSNRVQFHFAPDQTNLPSQIRLNWYNPFPTNLTIGDHWQFTVKLKPPTGMANPAGFDYEKWLFQQNIGATGYIVNSAEQQLLSSNNSINSLRQHLAEQIAHSFSSSEYIGVTQALVVGIKHQINDQQWQLLTETGTNHLLAISGLHIGLAALIGFFSFRYLWSRKASNLLIMPAQHIGALASIVTALTYAALAGFSIPTQRALIMVIAVMASELTTKPLPHSHRLALAAMIILIIDPFAILSPGFYLSFAAVAIILLLSQYRFPTPRRQWLTIHIAIALGLTPILITFFNQTSVISPIANLVAVPFVSLIIIPSLMISIICLLIYPPIGTTLLNLTHHLFEWLFSYLALLQQLPFAQWQSHGNSTLGLALLAICTLILLLPKGLPFKWLALLGLLPLFFKPNANQLPPNAIKLTLLDVGQGLAAVISTQNHHLVFDTGARFSDQFNAGKDIVLPYLRHQHIEHLDTLIVSHSDNDHLGGAQALIDKLAIGTILTGQPQYLPTSRPCYQGQTWHWDGVTFELLHPKLGQTGNDNNLSCVLKVSTLEHQLLLTGDIEKQAEQQLVQHYGQQLKSTVLIAPHHGSKSSSTQSFIEHVQADYVLFPAGYLNRYHFPAKSVLKRYIQSDAKTYITGKQGAITLQLLPGQKPKIQTKRQHNKKIWTMKLSD